MLVNLGFYGMQSYPRTDGTCIMNQGELPEGRHMRVENKNFYFDIGQNNRGIYMRISEVKMT